MPPQVRKTMQHSSRQKFLFADEEMFHRTKDNEHRRKPLALVAVVVTNVQQCDEAWKHYDRCGVPIVEGYTLRQSIVGTIQIDDEIYWSDVSTETFDNRTNRTNAVSLYGFYHNGERTVNDKMDNVFFNIIMA
jgi:hypothetical protein